MLLYEFEGKRILFEAGVSIPTQQLLDSPEQEVIINPPIVLKAQVLSGKRAKAGGIVVLDKGDDIEGSLKRLFEKTINGEKVEKVLAEERVQYPGAEHYISISYDTDSRGPLLTVSEEGGTGIEEHSIKTYLIDPLDAEGSIPDFLDRALFQKLVKLFFDNDCLLLEINPLVKTKDGEWMALDCKIKLDDDAKFRHPQWNFPPRIAPGHTPSKREIEAKKIDIEDPRGGVAGSSYLDLPGDIAVMSSGGGISLTSMDALIALGGKPANFTEYSGNPPKEKVTKLTKIVLNKPDIHGLWVIGTVAANFTDIYETLSGLVEGLREAEKELNTKFRFPIVIRRGGPREDEAFEMLKQVKDFDLHLQGVETSITHSAETMVRLAEEFKRKQEGVILGSEATPESNKGGILDKPE